ncbi:MAG: MMPL family transporter [Desulfuromonadaceae bacterium]|nr:MMPL family transporter [Desulfuromonas sp.]MDY0185415.1 MMPL family transporter [Desulfuromonadaceae bacterium]
MIRNAVDKNVQAIFRHPRTYLAALALLTLFFGYFYATLQTETSVESLIIEDDPDRRFYERFKEQFGEDEFLVVGFQHEDLFSPETLALIKQQTDRLEQIEEVKEVVSLSNVENIIGTDLDFIVEPLVDELPQNSAESSLIQQQATANPLIHDNLFSNKTSSSLFLIRTKPHPDDEGYNARLVAKVRDIFSAEEGAHNISYHIAGWLVTDVSMSEFMARDMMFFMPLTFGIIALFLWVFLRNLTAVAISLLTVLVSLVWAMALLNLIGGAMGPMTSILAPLIMALIVADAVHIFQYFLTSTDASSSPVARIQDTFKHLSIPCFLTSLTTALGFASLTLSDIPPIKHLGLAAAGGMMFEFVLVITLIPLCVYALRNKPGLWLRKEQGASGASSSIYHSLDRVLYWWSLKVGDYRKIIIVCALLVTGLSLYSLTQVQVETNLIDYFKQGTQVRTDANFFDDNLGGATTLEVSIKAAELDYFKRPEALEMIGAIEAYVNNWPFVTKSTNITSFLQQMNAAFHNNSPEFYKNPQDRNLIAQYLLLYDGDELAYFVNDDYNWARLSFRVNEHSSSILEEKIATLKQYLAQNFQQEEVEFNLTGKTYLVTKLVKSIIYGQIESLTFALITISVVLFWVFKSIRIGALSMIPNLFPIIINFGIMGLFNIPLNTATAIISALAIGIAVDDTIHYLDHYQAARKAGFSINDALISSIRKKGGAIVTTSVILTCGFVILCFSSFVPTIQFGMLCSIIMLTALVGDLVVLPAILSVAAHWRKS